MPDCRIALYRYPKIYDHRAVSRLFLRAVRENVQLHRDHNRAYRRMLGAAGFSPESLQTIGDLQHIPPVPTMFFKRHTLWTMNPERLAVKATSSGTGGEKSRIGLEAQALVRGAAMAAGIGRHHQLFSPVPTNYCIFGYEPDSDNQTAISKTQRASMLYAPPLSVKYALVKGKDGYRPDFAGVMEALARYERQPFPVRLKEQVYRLLEERLGIGEDSCREFFGAVEHPSLYCDCPRHHFHVPIYSRVIIRDVDTLRPLGFCEPGLVNLITPLADSMPLVSVLTDDLGILYPGEACGCGNPAPYFEILGRAGLTEIKTCAAGAAKILEGEFVR